MRFPGVNVKNYLYLIERAASQKRVACCYCGAENFSDRDLFICYNCELANSEAACTMRKSDQALAVRMAKIDAFLAKGDCAGAESEYENISNTYKDPESLYNSALLNIRCSNAERAAVRYDREGFMEENSVHMENASKRKSRAGLFLNRAALICEGVFKKGNWEKTLPFTFFMINIKLGNLKTARRALGMLREAGDPYLIGYAQMVFAAEQLKPEETASASVDVMKINPSPSALYYLAWAFFKGRKYRESTELLSGIRKYVDTSNVDALIAEIEKIKEV